MLVWNIANCDGKNHGTTIARVRRDGRGSASSDTTSLRVLSAATDQLKDSDIIAQTGACNGCRMGPKEVCSERSTMPHMSAIDSGDRASDRPIPSVGSSQKAFRAGFNLEKMHRGCLPAARYLSAEM